MILLFLLVGMFTHITIPKTIYMYIFVFLCSLHTLASQLLVGKGNKQCM